jgi:hypothetical protein
LDDVQTRHAPYLTVFAGTPCKVILRNALDLTKAIENGGSKDTRELPPGYENNPYRGDGALLAAASMAAKLNDPAALAGMLAKSAVGAQQSTGTNGTLPGVDVLLNNSTSGTPPAGHNAPATPARNDIANQPDPFFGAK